MPVPFNEKHLGRLPGGDERALRAGQEDAVRPEARPIAPIRLLLLRYLCWSTSMARATTSTRGLDVIAAMIHKYVVAAERGDDQVVLWGTGKPTARVPLRGRRRTGADPLRRAARGPDQVNIGTGRKRVSASWRGRSRSSPASREDRLGRLTPDGQPKRYLESRAQELIGFEAETPLDEGLVRRSSGSGPPIWRPPVPPPSLRACSSASGGRRGSPMARSF